MKQATPIVLSALFSLVGGNVMAANCAKNPNHSSCQGGDTTIIVDSALPTVVNGDGTIIGKAFGIGLTLGPSDRPNRGYADVRLTFDTQTEGSVGYSLRFYQDGISVGLDGAAVGTAVYLNGGCVGVPDFILAEPSVTKTDLQFSPFFGDNFTPVQHSSSSGLMVSLMRLSAPTRGYLPSPHYKANNGNTCTYYASSTYDQFLEVQEGYEISTQYIAPITFVPSQTE